MRTAMIGAMVLGGVLLIAGGSMEPGKPSVDKKSKPAHLNTTISLEDAPAKAWLKAQAGYLKGLNGMLRELAADAETFPESGAAASAYAKKSPKVSGDAFIPWETYVFKKEVDGKPWSSATFKARCLEMATRGDEAVEALRPYLE